MKSINNIHCLAFAVLGMLVIISAVGAECTDCENEKVTACPVCLCPFGNYSCLSDSGYGVEANSQLLIPGFNAYPLQGTAPLTVTFVDTSVGDPTAWSWAFGDGGTSNEQNPIHTYVTGGTFPVALTVTKITRDPDTGKSLGFPKVTKTIVRSQFITVTQTPGAEGVSVNPTYLVANQVTSPLEDSAPVTATENSPQPTPTFSQPFPVQGEKFFFNMIGYGFSTLTHFLSLY